MLEWVVRACRAARAADGVVVATTTEAADDAVADLAASLGVDVVRGSEDDVLARYVQAVDEHPRAPSSGSPRTARSPTPRSLTRSSRPGARTLRATTSRRCWCAPFPTLDVELVAADALPGRGHGDRAPPHPVTSGIYTDPEHFDHGPLLRPAVDGPADHLDTDDDLRALRAIVEARGNGIAGRREIIGLLRERPELADINAHIAQKALEAG